MSNFLGSKKVRTVLWVLGGLIVLFLAFGLGIAVGIRRAGFAVGFDRNYYRNFYGVTVGGPMGMMEGSSAAIVINGAAGTVIDVGSSTISIMDIRNNEQSVAVSSGTVIRKDNATITIGDIAAGDQIAVIGEPNDQGQIFARFIRVFDASSSSLLLPPRMPPLFPQ